jgi:hypothetical protein
VAQNNGRWGGARRGKAHQTLAEEHGGGQTDISQIPNMLDAIFRLREARRNEI